MTREEVKQFLKDQLKKLQDAHVADLMKVRRHEELEEILKDVELDFSPIEEFWKDQGEAIYQTQEEIPEEFCYELACYMNRSSLKDFLFFEDYEDYYNVLIELKEEVAVDIAARMNDMYLCNYTIRGLLK